MELYEKPGFENVSIKEFKNKSLAACTERSAMAHNLLKFMGFDSEIVFGKLNSDKGFHTYIIFKPENQKDIRILYDPMNPVVYIQDEHKKYGIGACVINEDEYSKLLNGNSFKFNYDFAKKRCPSGYACQENERVYTSDEYLYSKDNKKK